MAEVRGDLEGQMKEELEKMAKEESEKIIDALIERANEVLRQAAVDNDWNMGPIIDSVEKEWTGEAWIARWTYESDDGADIAAIFEYGAAPHEIEGNPLHWESDKQTEQTTFEREGAESGLQTQRRESSSGQFAQQEDTEDVFATVVQHPGIEAVGYIRAGRRHVLDSYEVGE